jgi:DNA-binding CsgD family transcriptional regulator
MLENLLQELVEGGHGIQTRTDGVAFLKVAMSAYPLATVSYVGLNIPIGAQRQRYLQCTYSDKWMKHCISREPLIGHRLGGIARALREPLDWGTLPRGAPDAEKLLEHANGSAQGGQLLSFPLRGLLGESAIFCIGAMLPAGEWEERKPGMLQDFHVLANYFHQHILRIYGNDTSKEILVSAREIDCLKWMAAGKTAWEASVILGISERTVRFHLNAAREKLNCLTTTQAVAKAVSQQLITV